MTPRIRLSGLTMMVHQPSYPLQRPSVAFSTSLPHIFGGHLFYLSLHCNLGSRQGDTMQRHPLVYRGSPSTKRSLSAFRVIPVRCSIVCSPLGDFSSFAHTQRLASRVSSHGNSARFASRLSARDQSRWLRLRRGEMIAAMEVHAKTRRSVIARSPQRMPLVAAKEPNA
jgi:hypothetical protein